VGGALVVIDDWVRLRLVDPAGPMFRQGELLPAAGTPSTDRASHASVRGAISAGAARPAKIAAASTPASPRKPPPAPTWN
jgi:hypothetical protein